MYFDEFTLPNADQLLVESVSNDERLQEKTIEDALWEQFMQSLHQSS